MLSYLISAVIICWLGIISMIIFRLRAHYYGLTTRTKKKNIDEVLDSILEKESVCENEIVLINKSLKQITSDNKKHFQKIGFLRFNPFDRVAGDQSFIISLLDAENSGLVLNFLYTREGVRIYAKQIKEGKAGEYDLSQEEKDVIKKAK